MKNKFSNNSSAQIEEEEEEKTERERKSCIQKNRDKRVFLFFHIQNKECHSTTI